MNLGKRRYSQIEDLPEVMAQMSISPKRLTLEMDILPPIKVLESNPFLPQLRITLNPEHSQLILYKPVLTLPNQGDRKEKNERIAEVKSNAIVNQSEMDWE